MQDSSSPNDSFPADLYGRKDRPSVIAQDLTDVEESFSRLAARLLANLAVGEMRLAQVFLAAANSADNNGYEALHLEYLRKAFVIVCEARFSLLQLPASERDLLLRGNLADELQLLQTQVLDAFSEDN